jgi:hypothetical protein
MGSFVFLVLATGCNAPAEDRMKKYDKEKLGVYTNPAFRIPGLDNSPGMMGSGIGMMQPSVRGRLTLTKEQVVIYVQDQLDRGGAGGYKVGNVKDKVKDPETIIVDVVTLDDVTVAQYSVDRHTGIFRSAR